MTMRDLFAVLLVLCGCVSNESTPIAPLGGDTESLYGEWLRLNGRIMITEQCTPTPLPHLTFTMGDHRASKAGEIRVPVWLDTEGRGTWGCLLFVEYDATRLDGVRVEPGELWDGADFVDAVANASVDGIFRFLVLGWSSGGLAIPAERTSLPIAYMVFRGERPGKARIAWLSRDESLIQRRAEALVDTDCGMWNVIDFLRTRPNITGLIDVETGSVVVVP